MKHGLIVFAALAVAALGVSAGADAAVYWNVFNIEGESSFSADIVTYATLDDMLHDTNRTGFGSPDTPGYGRNVVDSGSDGHVFWNVFNIEGESSFSADIVTYATLDDMLHDTNRTGFGSPDAPGYGRNVVGSGSDGTTYWNVFNIEGESGFSADIVTYATLDDMLHDTNRTGFGSPDAPGYGRNVVDSDSDGTIYWNVFNIEGESGFSADIVTYATLDDMLHDTNRTGFGSPDAAGYGRNVVGSGAFALPPSSGVPEPASWAMMIAGLGLIGHAMRRRQAVSYG